MIAFISIACQLHPTWSTRVIRYQCDQMARLFFQYLAIFTDERLTNSKNIGQILKQISKNCQTLYFLCQSGEILPNLAPLKGIICCHNKALVFVIGDGESRNWQISEKRNPNLNENKIAFFHNYWLLGPQCDQMAILFFQIWPFTRMKISPKA